MVCEFCCSHILESGLRSGNHHGDASTFENSVGTAGQKPHCVLCWRLAQNLLDESGSTIASWINPIHPDTARTPPVPVYRWSLRKAAKVDEMEDSAILIFRVVLIDEMVADRYKKRDEIPDVVFYLLREKDPYGHPGVAILTDNTAQSSDQIRKWTDNCNANHPKCQRKGDSFVPSRLIDVGLHLTPALREDSFLRVIEPENGFNKPYTTLSHSWGPKPYTFPLLLNGENGQDETVSKFTTKGISWKNLCKSKNFEHAIQVTRGLGIGYLWIDSLCIIQDNEDDWNRQTPLMHQIYRHSYCNIAASASKVPNDGLFQTRSETYPGQKLAAVTWQSETWRVVAGDLWQMDLLKSALYTRGWVFQERMLSPRMLHYASRQIFWDCATESACEAFPKGIPRQLDKMAAIDRNWRERLQTKQLRTKQSSDTANSASLFWRNAVASYTACNLTKHKDKLKAIWGIAKLVRDGKEDDYGAGLWAFQLYEQLAWTVADNSRAKRNLFQHRPAGLNDRWHTLFPSWSWASVEDGTILVANQIPDDERFYCVEDFDGGPIAFQLSKRLYPVVGNGDGRMEPALTPSDFDQEPQLKALSIPMRCLMGSAIVTQRRTNHGKGWGLILLGKTHETAGLEVFPDTLCNWNAGDSCEFVILTASEKVVGAVKDGVPQYGLARNTLKLEYSGTGLIVHKASSLGVYQRVGAFKFDRLPQGEWLEICLACGQDSGSASSFDKKRYRKIWLE